MHPGAPLDVSLSPTPSEIARLPTGFYINSTNKDFTYRFTFFKMYSIGNSLPISITCCKQKLKKNKQRIN